MKKNVIISGGLGLLGKQFAMTLMEKDYNVIVLDLLDKVDKYYESDEIVGSYVIDCDITDESIVKKTIEYIYDKFDNINILINAAAINPVPKEGEYNIFENYSLERWKKTLDVNLTGSFILSKEVIKFMLKGSYKEGFRGTIINIASDIGINAPDQDIYTDGYIKPPDYCVSKAGLISLTKYIASYYGSIIKSVCLAPGGVYNGQSEQFVKNLISRIPIGRMAKVEEYNGIILFLCSSDSDYMQGQTIVADGGRSII